MTRATLLLAVSFHKVPDLKSRAFYDVHLVGENGYNLGSVYRYIDGWYIQRADRKHIAGPGYGTRKAAAAALLEAILCGGRNFVEVLSEEHDGLTRPLVRVANEGDE